MGKKVAIKMDKIQKKICRQKTKKVKYLACLLNFPMRIEFLCVSKLSSYTNKNINFHTKDKYCWGIFVIHGNVVNVNILLPGESEDEW